MTLYVQRLQNGTPTTTPLDTYLAKNVPTDSTAKLQAGAAEIYAGLEALPVPQAVDPAHVCATADPALVYQSGTMHINVAAILQARLNAPVAPVAPKQPAPPQAKCTAAEQTAYDELLAQYRSDAAAYQTANAQYVADTAAYENLVQNRTKLATQTATFEAELKMHAAAAGSSSGPNTLQEIVRRLQAVRQSPGSVTHELKQVEAISAMIADAQNAWAGDPIESSVAGAMAIHRLLLWLYGNIFERNAEQADAAAVPI